MSRKFFIFFLYGWILVNCSDSEEAKKRETNMVTTANQVDQMTSPVKSTDHYVDKLRQGSENHSGKLNMDMARTVGDNSSRDCPECPEMITIPMGHFIMGSEHGESNEKPAHRLEVPALSMSRYEITRKEFRQFIKSTGYKTEAEMAEGCVGWTGSGWEQKTELTWHHVGFSQEETHPVVCVSWNDAVAYTQWLSQKTGHTYRLPTEVEWEYAARAGTTTHHWWGNSISHEYANYGQETCCHGLAQGQDRWEFTAPVGSFGANPFGLYDTAGNVWEWTCSRYESSYQGYELTCDVTPKGQRVLRGGAWDSIPDWINVASRSGDDLTHRFDGVGLRVVKVVH